MAHYLIVAFSILLVYLILAELFLSSMKAEVEAGDAFDFKQTMILVRYVFGFKKIGPSAGRFAPLLLLLLRVTGGLYVLVFAIIIYVANFPPAAR